MNTKPLLFSLLSILAIMSCNETPKPEETSPTSPAVEKLPTVETPEEDLGKFGFKAGITPSNPLEDAEQLIISIVPDDKTIMGVMYQYEKKEGNWIAEGKGVLTSIGKHGLAWGKGEMDEQVMRGFKKQEGDGKAPAGIFSLGKAFGYASKEEASFIKLPYIQSTDTYFCVDDVESEYYNSMVNTNNVNKDWNSAEDMLRKDGLYEWGIFVNHNNTPMAASDGSCIMIHIWRGQKKPTHGCTAFAKPHLVELLKWLDPAKNPRLVQITKGEYPQMKEWFGLPNIEF
jgi:L,D-peptidoglycan transpeptidase YkuD (ErfK/YbiS/YcfS/YnhG family)